MDRQPPATRVNHEKFCVTEGWQERKRADGRRGSHHVNYELPLTDGRVLLTRISHPVDRSDYGPSIWKHILRDQLEVTHEEFWACVRQGILPQRGEPIAEIDSIPLWALRILRDEVHMSERDLKKLSAAEAAQAVADFYARRP